MIINETPVRTSNNYSINNCVIPDNLLNYKVENFNDTIIASCDGICVSDYYDTNNNNFLNGKLNCNLSKKIKVNKDVLKPIYISFNLDKNNIVSNLFLEIAENVRANIVVDVISNNNCLHSGGLNIKLKENSELNIVIVNYLKNEAINLFKQESEILSNAKLNVFVIDFGCSYSVWENKETLIGDNGESNLDVIYVGTQTNKLDFNLEQVIYGEHCNCNINCVGALLNESSKNFKGTITFNKGCKKSVGDENEFCMLLSNKAKSKALPMLLCKEEDVNGNHATAVGKIDKRELFYIMSRGLTKLEATKLIVKAKFAQVLNKLFDEALKEKILKEIDERVKGE